MALLPDPADFNSFKDWLELPPVLNVLGEIQESLGCSRWEAMQTLLASQIFEVSKEDDDDDDDPPEPWKKGR